MNNSYDNTDLIKKGEQAFADRDYEQAMKIFKNILKKDANDKNAIIGLKITLLKLGTDSYRSGQIFHALNFYRDAYEIAPDDDKVIKKYVEILNKFGNIKLKNTKFKEALEFFNKILEIQPDNYEAINGREMALKRKTDDKVNQIKPSKTNEEKLSDKELNKKVDLSFKKAEEYLKEERFIDAHKLFTEILNLKDHSDYVFDDNKLLMLANTSIKNNDLKNAYIYFNKLLRKNPDNPYALSGILEIFIKIGNDDLNNSSYNKALNEFNIALKDYDDLKLTYGKGLALIGLNDFEEALKCFNDILKINPNHLNSLLKKANVLYNLKRFEEGFSCINKFLEIDKQNIDACLLKIKFLIMNDEYENALNHINKALYYTNSADLYYHKYIILKNLGNYTDAKKELKNAINIDPNNETFNQEIIKITSDK